MAQMGTLRLPAEPLLTEVERLGGVVATLRAAGLPTRKRDRRDDSAPSAENTTLSLALDRAERRGWIYVLQVDELCLRFLRRHPFEIYGDEWFFGPDDNLLQKRLAELPDPFSKKGKKRATKEEEAA